MGRCSRETVPDVDGPPYSEARQCLHPNAAHIIVHSSRPHNAPGYAARGQRHAPYCVLPRALSGSAACDVVYLILQLQPYGYTDVLHHAKTANDNKDRPCSNRNAVLCAWLPWALTPRTVLHSTGT